MITLGKIPVTEPMVKFLVPEGPYHGGFYTKERQWSTPGTASLCLTHWHNPGTVEPVEVLFSPDTLVEPIILYDREGEGRPELIPASRLGL